MRVPKSPLVMTLVAALAATAWAQPASQPAVPAQPILEMIPAGTMGYAVVPSVKGSFAAVDQYLKDIGVADMGFLPPDLLEAMVSDTRLAAGFNPQGGFAAVMLDPQPFGVDLLKMMDEGPGMDGNELNVPFVLFVPGSGVKEVFGNYTMEPKGAYTLVNLRMGPMYAAASNGYVILSPMAKFLDAVVKSEKKAAGEISKEQADLIAKSQLSVHANMKIAGPLLQGLLTKAMAQAQEGPAEFKTIANLLPMASNIISQLQALMYTVQFGKTGLMINEYVQFQPESPMGKALASVKGGASLLGKLPNLSYVLAAGGVSGGAKVDAQMNILDALLKSLPNVPDATKERIRKNVLALDEQVTASQFVLGGAPKDSGVFGFACVMTCKDAQKTKDILSDSAQTVADLIKAVVADPDIQNFAVLYAKDAEKVDALSVDTIEITHPELTKMSPEDKAKLKTLLGEEKVRVMIAAPNNNTVVMTFGGSTTFLAEAIKTAKAGGTIESDPAVVEVMNLLPKQPSFVLLFNVSHVWDLLTEAMKATDNEGTLPPIQITTTTPLALAAATSGSSVHAVIYIPTKLVKELVEIGVGMLGGGGARATTQPATRTGGDF